MLQPPLCGSVAPWWHLMSLDVGYCSPGEVGLITDCYQESSPGDSNTGSSLRAGTMTSFNIYFIKVSHEKHCGYCIHPYHQVPRHPISVIVHQHSKIPQTHYLSSLCYTVFPVILPTPCVLISLPPHLPSSMPPLW